ncbi:MAG TPA: YceI family protein [Vicinamibacterales bacterium]|nr:YceI family protein [Vicinamibacterales bacterium]
MTRRIHTPILTTFILIAGFCAISASAVHAQTPLSLSSAVVSIDGTSNIHDFTASTKDVRMTKLVIARGGSAASLIANPTTVEAFEIVIKAASLSSPKDGLDKNMHKALKVTEFPEIVFRLNRLEGSGPALKAFGSLKIAGVEKDIVMDIKVAATATTLTVSGQLPMLMTDYGIAAPKAMMGMLKTSPKITVKFETVLAVPTTY